MRLRNNVLLAVASVAIALAVWLPCVHLVFRPADSQLWAGGGLAPLPRKIANRQIELWTNPQLLDQELGKMRRANAEWDFMARSFLAWSLANVALRDPQLKPAALEVIDRIIDQTLDLERKHGQLFFLMPYANNRPFVQTPPRTLVVDGEIALMLAVRCTVADKDQYRQELARRIDIIVRRMEASPTLSAESYPDECWTFCNAIALAAIRISDYLVGSDHSGLIRRWLHMAQEKLVDPRTGLFISAYHLDGRPIYGTEGSSIWMVLHALSLVDIELASREYQKAWQILGGNCLGFGFAREWAAGVDEGMDVDSGLVAPGLGASAASSGLAFVAAGTFGDKRYLRSLATTLEFAGFPIDRDGRRTYAATNQVGEAVVLYGLVTGPLWDKVRGGGK